ncbi:MAG: alpha-glucosidase C-terminal domain-containing protein, partial [Gammaproteobacteria bacterium]|nr:alpha-glucosidase C-terminal domain-containing protein [Gammaproteobacteria bacterium]
QDDTALRPCLELETMQQSAPQPKLPQAITRLAALRAALPALRRGAYRQLSVAHEQLAFARFTDSQYVVVLLNASSQPADFDIQLPLDASHALDRLNPGEEFPIQNNRLRVGAVDAHWGRVLIIE